MPRPTMVPAAGFCVFTNWFPRAQASETLRPERKSGTAALQAAPAGELNGVGQTIEGGVLSTTLTVTEACALKLPESVTVSVTRCEPKESWTERTAVLPRTMLPSRHW